MLLRGMPPIMLHLRLVVTTTIFMGKTLINKIISSFCAGLSQPSAIIWCRPVKIKNSVFFIFPASDRRDSQRLCTVVVFREKGVLFVILTPLYWGSGKHLVPSELKTTTTTISLLISEEERYPAVSAVSDVMSDNLDLITDIHLTTLS